MRNGIVQLRLKREIGNWNELDGSVLFPSLRLLPLMATNNKQLVHFVWEEVGKRFQIWVRAMIVIHCVTTVAACCSYVTSWNYHSEYSHTDEVSLMAQVHKKAQKTENIWPKTHKNPNSFRLHCTTNLETGCVTHRHNTAIAFDILHGLLYIHMPYILPTAVLPRKYSLAPMKR